MESCQAGSPVYEPSPRHQAMNRHHRVTATPEVVEAAAAAVAVEVGATEHFFAQVEQIKFVFIHHHESSFVRGRFFIERKHPGWGILVVFVQYTMLIKKRLTSL